MSREHCEVCHIDAAKSGRCSNRRCPACHKRHCSPGSSPSDRHGRGTPRAADFHGLAVELCGCCSGGCVCAVDAIALKTRSYVESHVLGACPICHAATTGHQEDVVRGEHGALMTTRHSGPGGLSWPMVPCRGAHTLGQLRETLGLPALRADEASDVTL